MPTTEPTPPVRPSRRTFALGLAGASLGVAIGPHTRALAAPAAGPALSFDETTLWDSATDPLENYHVHALTVLPDDTILAVTEGRYEVCDAGPRDLLLRRSTDGGDTWGPTRTIVVSEDGASWGNPALLADRETGTVFCFYMLSLRLPENTSCSGDIGDLWMISSDDAGATWSAPTAMSGMFDHFPYDWALHGPGPGHGIQLDTGRLLLNCAHRRVIVGNTVEERLYGVSTLYSDDHGASWHAAGEVPVSVDYPINEARLFQRSDGTVVVNGRSAAGGNRQRIVAVSDDRGLTWARPALDGATGMFNAVDASLVRYTGGPGGEEPSRLLFSRPDSPVRTNMTVSVSYDEGHSFPYSRVVNAQRSYYSDLARLSDGTIVLLYGCEGEIASAPRKVNVARFSLDWLTEGRDSLGRGPARTERLIPLATGGQATGGTFTTVADPLARGGELAVLTASAPGARLRHRLTPDRSGEHQLWLRYHRSAAGALIEVTVDGERPRTAVLDTTRENADGYDIAYLGTLPLTGGHTLDLTVAGAGRGGGLVLAVDALSLVRVPHAPDVREEVVVDNDALGYQAVSGTWSPATGTPGFWGGNYRTAPAGSGGSSVRWRPVVPGEGDYLIEVSYAPHANRASDAPYRVTHADGVSVVRVDQRAAGTPDPRGGTWAPLGTFPLTAGLDTTIELSDDADGFVIADAIRLRRRP
ncbi:exo-alpha-sialidase [Streptomyces profundus]|uniref:golvesin C-terminal-like domain-containing protein n=1 Tax=Streptomyces profundus TaxID=2867410 RepID=UPI001D162A0A|nr:exo-alpha-sialidase [Streptomyces sp. MA3_2.13]UED87970.1 exo-alpha-sialidase [Streptomyces sp. MA3_2.13]